MVESGASVEAVLLLLQRIGGARRPVQKLAVGEVGYVCANIKTDTRWQSVVTDCLTQATSGHLFSLYGHVAVALH